MRFGEMFGHEAIPEWKECYINYEIMKIFVQFIRKLMEDTKKINEIRDKINTVFVVDEATPIYQQIVRNPLLEELRELQERCDVLMHTYNEVFFEIYERHSEIAELFYQMKVLEMEENFQICQRLAAQGVEDSLHPLLLSFVEYTYVEVVYVSEMRLANLLASRKILKKHRKTCLKTLETPRVNYDRINRIAHIQGEYIEKIENLYVRISRGEQSLKAREYLRKTTRKAEASWYDSFFSGLWIGISASLLVLLIFIILYGGLSVENNSNFSRDFPTWRGPAIFIIYIWVLGFNVYMFEKYKISHTLIFKFHDHHSSTSTDLFKLAGLFTSIYLLLFLIYLLQITDIITSHTSFTSEYIVSIMWGLLSLYLFNPFRIINYEGRLYAMRLLARCLASPILGVTFPIIWMTDQWISLNTPLRDLAYTVCYFTQLDFTKPNANPCKNSSNFQVILLVVVIAMSFRMLQCMRAGYQEGVYFGTRNFVNTLKYLASLLSAIASYFYSAGVSDMLAVWITISIVSTLFSYTWDIKVDWQLVEPNNRNFLLRKYLTFEPKRNYYVIMALNFVMRCAWSLTLSPQVVQIFGNSAILTLATGSIEILRRGVWNLLRVQKEHLANCGKFKALPDLNELKAKLMGSEIAAFIDIMKASKAENDLEKEFLRLILMRIQDKEKEESRYGQEYIFKERQKIKVIKRDMRGIMDKVEEAL